MKNPRKSFIFFTLSWVICLFLFFFLDAQFVEYGNQTFVKTLVSTDTF